MRYEQTKQLNNGEDKNKKGLVYIDGVWEKADIDRIAEYHREMPDDWTLAQDNHKKHRYEIAVQCFARQEEKYFKEWIEHHLRIGIDHIFIYDNNDEEGLETFLKSVLSETDFSKIEVIPWREPMEMQQFGALEDCVQNHKYDVKWLMSIDLDEFFVVEKPMKEFLDEFADASQVYFSWESFGADGQLHYENKPLCERFRKPFDCKDSGQGKIMFRPERLKKWGIHGASLTKGKTVNVLHEEIVAPDSFNRIFKTAWIKHYFTKSLEEWMEKMERGCADNLYCRRYNTFFEINPDLKQYYDPNARKIQKHSLAPQGEVPMI